LQFVAVSLQLAAVSQQYPAVSQQLIAVSLQFTAVKTISAPLRLPGCIDGVKRHLQNQGT